MDIGLDDLRSFLRHLHVYVNVYSYARLFVNAYLLRYETGPSLIRKIIV